MLALKHHLRPMKIKDKAFELYLDDTKIINKVKELAEQINRDYKDKNPLFIAILNGSFMFAADLMKYVDVESQITFIKVSSYIATQSTGNIKEAIGLQENIFQRDIIIIEDIVDSGKTLTHITERFKELGPKSVEIATLLHKPEVNKTDLSLKYVGFDIPNKFVIGYGLDYDGYGRNEHSIYQLSEEKTNTQNMLNLVLFGPPGAGKGTQSEKIIDKYKLTHIATGDLFRKNLSEGTPLGKLAQGYMDEGHLVPDQVVIDMVDEKIKETGNSNGFIFDGFPRTVAQAKALDELLTKNGTSISGMVALEVSEEELVKRILERGKTSGRADDQNIEKIQTRVKIYNNETLPVASFYKAQNKFSSINGIGGIDDIFGNISETIDGLI